MTMAKKYEEKINKQKIIDQIRDYIQNHPNINPALKRRFMLGELTSAEVDDFFDKYIQSNPEIATNFALLAVTPQNKTTVLGLNTDDDEFIAMLTNPDTKEAAIQDFYSQKRFETHDDIFEYATIIQNYIKRTKPEKRLFAIVSNRFNLTIDASKNAFLAKRASNKDANIDTPMPDLRNFIIVGDIDISGYKGKIEESVSSILPYAVTNKLYCSGWDRNLFNIIKKLPYAETIDCSMSIKDLGALKNDDGSYKLPIGLKNLVVQSSIIDPDAFLSRKKDYQQKRDDAHDLINAYPDLNIIAIDKNGKEINLKDSLAIAESQEASAKKQEAVVSKQLTTLTPIDTPNQNIPLISAQDTILKTAITHIVNRISHDPSISGLGFSGNELSRIVKIVSKEDVYNRRMHDGSAELVKCLSTEYVNNDEIKTKLLEYMQKYYPNKFESPVSDIQPIPTTPKTNISAPTPDNRNTERSKPQNDTKQSSNITWLTKTVIDWINGLGNQKTDVIRSLTRYAFYGNDMVIKTDTRYPKIREIKVKTKGGPRLYSIGKNGTFLIFKTGSKQKGEKNQNNDWKNADSDIKKTYGYIFDQILKNPSADNKEISGVYCYNYTNPETLSLLKLNNKQMQDLPESVRLALQPIKEEPKANTGSSATFEAIRKAAQVAIEEPSNAGQPVELEEPQKPSEPNIVDVTPVSQFHDMWTLQELADNLGTTKKEVMLFKKAMPDGWIFGKTKSMRFKTAYWKECQELFKEYLTHKSESYKKCTPKKQQTTKVTPAPNTPTNPSTDEKPHSIVMDGLLGIKGISAFSHAWNKWMAAIKIKQDDADKLLARAEQDLSKANAEVTRISNEIAARHQEEKEIGDLWHQGIEAERKLNDAKIKKQAAEATQRAIKARFEEGTKLINKYNKALEEKQIAESNLQKANEELDAFIKRIGYDEK